MFFRSLSLYLYLSLFLTLSLLLSLSLSIYISTYLLSSPLFPSLLSFRVSFHLSPSLYLSFFLLSLLLFPCLFLVLAVVCRNCPCLSHGPSFSLSIFVLSSAFSSTPPFLSCAQESYERDPTGNNCPSPSRTMARVLRGGSQWAFLCLKGRHFGEKEAQRASILDPISLPYVFRANSALSGSVQLDTPKPWESKDSLPPEQYHTCATPNTIGTFSFYEGSLHQAPTAAHESLESTEGTSDLRPTFRERNISPKLSCIKFFWEPSCTSPKSQDVLTQIAGHPGHALPKTTENGALHKVFVRDIPGPGSGISRRLGHFRLFSVLNLTRSFYTHQALAEIKSKNMTLGERNPHTENTERFEARKTSQSHFQNLKHIQKSQTYILN